MNLFLWLFLAIIVATVVVPGILAYEEDVFFMSDMERQEAAANLTMADTRLKVIAALEPSNLWSAVLSSVVVLITFMLPVIRAIIGK